MRRITLIIDQALIRQAYAEGVRTMGELERYVLARGWLWR